MADAGRLCGALSEPREEADAEFGEASAQVTWSDHADQAITAASLSTRAGLQAGDPCIPVCPISCAAAPLGQRSERAGQVLRERRKLVCHLSTRSDDDFGVSLVEGLSGRIVPLRA